MKMKMIAGACLCAAAIVGCVSLEERLASTDPAVRKEAEQDLISRQNYVLDAKARMEAVKRVQDEEVLCNFAMTIDDPLSERYQDRRPEAMVAVGKITKDELLAKIALNGASSQIRSAAFGKIKKEDVKEQVKKSIDARAEMEQAKLLHRISRAKHEGDTRRLKKLIMMLDFSRPEVAKEILSKHQDLFDEIEGLEGKVCSNLTEQELRKCLESDIRQKDKIALRLIEVTEDTAWLYKMFKNKLSYSGWGEPSDNAANRLAKLADKIEDENVMQEILEREDDRWCMIVKDSELRKGVLKRMNETNAIGMVEGCLWRHFGNSSKFGRTDWDTGYFAPIGDAATLAMISKNPKTVVKMEAAVYSAIDHYEDGERKTSFLAKLPKLTEEGMVDLLCYDEYLWKKFVDNVSVDVAYKVLASGRAKSSEFEVALLKKLPKERIDLNVYNGVHADSVKKGVLASMSPECQKQVREANEKVFAAIVEKAKSASKETFALDGFYLGMSWEDMKIVLAHHFPELKVTEKDDDGLELYVSNQKSAFCLANKEKKIYQFNFGKKMLKKWYKYDVQDYAQWARAYGREHKVDMQYKMVEEEATVYEPMDPSRSYKVWFYQHSYQYKHNAKEYRLTYFGDEKDFTVHGGIGGALIKQLAAKKFRYTRGDPGSLRVYIDKD